MRADRRRRPLEARQLAVDAVEHVRELDHRRAATSARQPGPSAISAAPTANTTSVASVTWFGVTRVARSGTSSTAASGRATNRFQRMSFGLLRPPVDVGDLRQQPAQCAASVREPPTSW